jgi:hypothetical protein
MTQEEELLQILTANKSVQFILNNAHKLDMPNWYLGAGGIVQTIWNIKHGFDPEHGIKDYDLVYFDAVNISAETQENFIQKGKELFESVPVLVEIVNEARVHLWYRKEFGYPTDQDKYNSVEEAISIWPTTATATGVRKNPDGTFSVYAPFGLDDLLNLIVRPNKLKITKEVYLEKVNRWTKVWPKLKVIPWD